MEKQLYVYKANVTDIYDGDTITVNIDLGLSTWIHGEKIRLHRIDTPEIRGEERPLGLAARDYLCSLIMDKEIILQTIKDRREKYGRYLGEIWALNSQGEYFNVNDKMIAEGYAKLYIYP
ncbi:MAG: thermonuclease family protein [Candidatus Zhuqueibacterota bacterium]